jgi:hypothetical protein
MTNDINRFRSNLRSFSQFLETISEGVVEKRVDRSVKHEQRSFERNLDKSWSRPFATFDAGPREAYIEPSFITGDGEETSFDETIEFDQMDSFTTMPG